eukprot:12335684-Ditylum_brightwellii.AAC.1
MKTDILAYVLCALRLQSLRDSSGGFTSSAPDEFLLLPRLGAVVLIMFLFKFSMLSSRLLKVVFPPELRFMGGDTLCLACRLSCLAMVGDCRP